MKYAQIIGLSILLLSPVAAKADQINITAVGQTFEIDWSYLIPSSTLTLNAQANFTVAALSSSQVVLDMTIANNTVLNGYANAGLASFGFNMDPTATAVAVTNFASGPTWSATLDDNIPSLGHFDICTWAGNNCNGGSQNDLLVAGASDHLLLSLTGTFGNTPAVAFFDDGGIKFQTSIGSYEFTGGGPGPGPGPGPTIPEPTSLVLLGTGLVALATLGRRFRKP